MLHGKIETRVWPTPYRGQVLLCASKVPYSADERLELSGREQVFRMPFLCDPYGKELLGHAFAVGNLVDCRKMTEADEDACFVKYRPGLWCHIYEDVRLIQPFPWKGVQGLKPVPPEILDQIIYIE